MAQLANGCTLQYTIATGSDLKSATGALTWVDIDDITSIPELFGSTGAVETTRIKDLQKTYIPSILDPGGAMECSGHWTKELLDASDAILAVQDTKEIGFRVLMPAPLSMQVYFTGKIAPIGNEAIESEGIIGAKLSIYPGSAIERKLNSEVTNENPFKV